MDFRQLICFCGPEASLNTSSPEPSSNTLRDNQSSSAQTHQRPKTDEACRQQTVLLGGSLPQNPSVLATSIYMDQFLLKSGIENGGHREEMETDGTDVTSTGFFSRPL